MWVFEQNYVLMAGLFPALIRGSKESVSIRTRVHDLQLQVVETGRYTLTVKICHRFIRGTEWLPDFNMTVRVYNDARLVEVQDYQDSGKLLAEYPRINRRMFHRDEKKQANRLLWEWLRQISARTSPLVSQELVDV